MPFILAPMAGITDLPARLIAREFACPLAFTEMVNARGLGMENVKTLELLRSSSLDRPLGVQLLGHEPDHLRRALDALHAYRYDLIDLNAACPVRKVTKKGEGAALLKDPVRLIQLVATLVEHAPVPVTVKIRSGWDASSVNAVEIARRIADAGADALCVHARTKEQAYRGKADLNIIRAVKQAVAIPVIASGDMFSGEACREAMRVTGCDAVMIARGALGNPWIFRELAAPSTGMETGQPQIDEIVTVMQKHLASSIECHGEVLGVLNFRKFFIWYTRGMRDARTFRPKAVQMTTGEQMRLLIDELRTSQLPGSSRRASRSLPCDPHRGSGQAGCPGYPLQEIPNTSAA